MSGMMSSRRRKRECESGNHTSKRVEIVVIDPEDVKQCGICNLKDPLEPFVTACAHGFCRECLVQYFKSMMISQVTSDLKPLCCPYSSCSSEVRHADLTNLVGEEHVRNYKNWLVSALDNLYNRQKSFPISNTRSSTPLPCVNCSCDSANLIKVNQVPQLSYKEVQGVLKARGLKCTRSKKAGVESLMNYFGNSPLLWMCTSCSNMWCEECGMEVAHDEIHTERCTAVNTPQHHHRRGCQLYAAMMDLDSVSRHYLLSSSSVEDKNGKTISTSTTSSAVWAKGTGFGGGQDNKTVRMALDAARKRQLEEDNLIKGAVSSLIKALNESPYLSVSVCAILCMGGILNRMLLQLATNDSMLDIYISERQDLYLKMIELLDAIAPYPELESVLSGSSDDLLESKEYTIMQKLETLYKQAKLMLHSSNQAVEGDLTLAMELCRCYEKLGSGSSSSSSVSRQQVGLEVEIVEISAKTMYIEKLRPLQFKLLSTATQHFSHYFREVDDSSIDKGGAHNHKRMLRIQKEVASLSTSLPLQWESSIHICVEEDRMDMLKALIVGPCGTPYQNGIFLFDIFLPSDYPQVPPKVQFLTTGGGTVRFNPNLYDNGYVCLSLLGTWSGPGWVPGESTLLQVLVSIQSLIFVKDPYYNEPGFDTRESTPAAEAENMRHRENTLSLGILSALESPEKMFQDVIREHFRFKKQEIEKQCDEWIESTQEQQAKSRMSAVSGSIKSKLRAWC